MVDLAVQSTTGVKAGFSETLESQINKMLHTTAAALKETALSGHSSKDKDAGLSEDAYLDAHAERRPVVVMDNFLHQNEDKAPIVYEKMASWAATLVHNKVAHVVFLSSDATCSKLLSRAMPDRMFRNVSLDDLSHDVAKAFVLARLDEAETGDDDGDEKKPRRRNLAGLDDCIERLGGRLTDLELLSRRMHAGQRPQQAVEEIVGESAADILRVFLLRKAGGGEARRWTSLQAWQLVAWLAERPTVSYDAVLLSPAFAGGDGEAALEALAAGELIAVQASREGRPRRIAAGKPLYRAAFDQLTRDAGLRTRMQLRLAQQAAQAEARAVADAELELLRLGSLPRQPAETAGRVAYLLRRLEAAQQRIEALDRDVEALTRLLGEDD